MTFASHVVTTASLKCHILIKIFITIFFYHFDMIWIYQWQYCLVSLYLDEKYISLWGCVFCGTCQWRFKHVHMELSPVFYNPCNLRAWNRRMRSYVRNGVYHCKISPTSFDPCNISIFIAYFRPKLSCHSFVAKTEITTGTSIATDF